MADTPSIFIGRGESPVHLDLKMANRHGLIAGATGTGKTVTLQILAEGFSAAGVPVFTADVKGDLAGLSRPGTPKDFLMKRAETVGLSPYGFDAVPTLFWDVFGVQGHPVRTTVSEMGPLLLARLLELNEAQEGVLTIAFRVADDEGLELLDLADLRSMLAFLSEQRAAISARYGNVAAASVGAIQRRLLVLEHEGADRFFGEPALALSDLMRTDAQGRGLVSILAADRLMQSPRLYATLLLWLLSELFEDLPETGDLEKPKLVFFFDEAHLLFAGAPKALIDKIAQVAKLIRSKGVGVFFVTQNPQDVPDNVLAQLGSRIQHALRAYTPNERRAVRAAAQSFRPNPAFDTEAVIGELGIGEALVSTLGAKGVPSMVARTLIRPPSSRLGVVSEEERRASLAASPLAGVYDTALDRDSAHEALERRAARQAAVAHETAPRGRSAAREDKGLLETILLGDGRRQSPAEAFAKSLARRAGSKLGDALLRGLFGTRRRR